jgi:hypothetical protein
MIWFACKQCGKRHGRAEGLVGTLVFCECGQGNRVPWTSTAPEPEEAAPPVPVPSPGVPRSPSPAPREERPDPDLPAPRRYRKVRRPNPAYCLNHDDVPSEETCDDCRAAFCSACVVKLQGKTLCGPCKNFRIRGISRPARVAPLAVLAFILAAVSGPVTFVITLMGLGMGKQGALAPGVLLCLIGLALPVAALALSGMALRAIETTPHAGGRGLATTGMTTALVDLVWGLAVAVVILGT